MYTVGTYVCTRVNQITTFPARHPTFERSKPHLFYPRYMHRGIYIHTILVYTICMNGEQMRACVRAYEPTQMTLPASYVRVRSVIVIIFFNIVSQPKTQKGYIQRVENSVVHNVYAYKRTYTIRIPYSKPGRQQVVPRAISE